jgi:hypothetical protein
MPAPGGKVGIVNKRQESQENPPMKEPPNFLQRFHGTIAVQDRMRMFHHKPATIWLTGTASPATSASRLTTAAKTSAASPTSPN